MDGNATNNKVAADSINVNQRVAAWWSYGVFGGEEGESVNTDVMFSSASVEWETPQDFFDRLNKEFNFTLDPCSTSQNAKCKYFYTKVSDGLRRDWQGETVFCNPPYGREIKHWVKKCYEESRNKYTTVVALLPARTDTTWFHEFIYGKAEVRFVKGRLKFGGCKNSAPFPSMVVVWR